MTSLFLFSFFLVFVPLQYISIYYKYSSFKNILSLSLHKQISGIKLWLYVFSLLIITIIHIFKIKLTLRKKLRSSSINPKATCSVRLCLQACIPWELSVIYSLELLYHTWYINLLLIFLVKLFFVLERILLLFKLRGIKNILPFPICLQLVPQKL